MSTIEMITITCSLPLYGQGVEIGGDISLATMLREVEVYEFKG